MSCASGKLACLAALLLLTLTGTGAASEKTPQARVGRVQVPRVSTPPKIADYLENRHRADELHIHSFVQREPNDGAAPALQTDAYLSHDDSNLYAIFVCKEDPRKIHAHMGNREDTRGDDVVSLSLDTFHDGRRAYEFLSNALGVQRDAVLTEGQDDDFSFDTVWRSEGRITPDGFIVRMAIPFKSLRFRPARGATWGIALTRYAPAINELSTWPHLSERMEAYVPQFATMEAMEGTSPGRNLQFIPYGFFAAQRFLNTSGGSSRFAPENEWRGGLDTKYVLHDSLTFDFTVQPDFSQVESDEPQVTVNRRYEVFFPEKRPFFTEGAGYFQTPETLFFSRRIADPKFGARMTGKAGRWGLGWLAMDDRAPGSALDPADPMYQRSAKVTVLRATREIGKESYAGFFFSRSSFGPASNQVLSLDTRIKLNPNWVLTGQAARAGTRDTESGSFAGTDYFAELRHSGLHTTYSASYLDRSPNFRADLGFIPRADLRQVKNSFSYRWRPERGRLASFGPSAVARSVWDHKGLLQEWSADVPFSFEFKGATSVSFGRLEMFERFAGLGFRENASYVTVSSQRLRWLRLDATYTHGTNINYFPAEGITPFLAGSEDASLGVTLRPTSRMSLEESYIYSRLGGIHESGVTSAAIFNNHLWRTKVNYQFTRALSLRAIVDYDAVLANPSLVDLERSKAITADVLLTYMIHPGTVLYAGYTDRRENLGFDAQGQTLRRTTSPDLSTGRQFFLKVSYLFRF